MAKTYEEFVQDLYESSDAVFVVAKWLHRRKYDLFIPKIKIKPRYAKSIDYVDDGDLHIIKNGVTQKVNVKGWPDKDFSETHFPYEQIMVANKGFVDIKGDDIDLYMTLNRACDCVCVVNTKKTREHWSLFTYYAKNSRQIETVYMCPVKLAKFFKV